MESCRYEPVRSEHQEKGHNHRIHFLRQFTASFATWIIFFMAGMILGAPTVIIPQLRREANSTEAVSVEMASWMFAAIYIGGIPFEIVSVMAASFFGRKMAIVFICVISTVNFIYISFSSLSLVALFISQLLFGGLSSCVNILGLLIIAEYTSPRYRGVFLTAKSASYVWGIWVSNAIGTFLHWKYIFYFGVICSATALVLFLSCPESPYWLASKGKIDECAATHRWLRGVDPESEKEIEILLHSAKESISHKNKFTAKYIKKYVTGCGSREFWKPLLLGFLLILSYSFTGKFVCVVYAIDIIKKITDSEYTAYLGMLILDGVTVFGMYVGSLLSIYFKRRKFFFVTSTLGVLFLSIMSLYLYLIQLDILVENPYVSIIILIMFSLAISCGPMILSSTIRAEIIPLKNRSVAVFTIALATDFSGATLLKNFPYLYKTLGLHGAFLFFGIVTIINLLLLYKYLPETKDKTLQEIAALMK